MVYAIGVCYSRESVTDIYYIEKGQNEIEFIKNTLDDVFNKAGPHPVIYIHNLSKFDIHFIFKNILKYKPEICLRDNNILGFNLKFKKETIKVRDSYLVLNSSISSLGEIFNLPKGDIPHDLINVFNIHLRDLRI